MDVTEQIRLPLERFGLESFRPGQEQVIEAVFTGRDCLCIMPTGGGKSLCFQLPAVSRAGTVLVVSPLIALMKDQVDSLVEQQIAATFINSSLSAAQQRERISAMMQNRFDLVYIAPERLRSRHFVEAIRKIEIQLLAVDEAHCISQWGHDFRPDYARLGRFRQRLGSPQTIALTATATETVRRDVCDVLQLSDPAIFVSGFARDNLSLFVQAPSSNSDKDRKILEFLRQTPGAGIIYCSTRKSCEQLTDTLSRSVGHRSIAVYHAGLEATERREIQEKFWQGKIDLIVATNAFGMGIDKSDLRFVVHYNLPGSIEAYYQEAGRAGRDGKPAKCLLFYSYQDRFIQEFFIENSYPSAHVVKQVYHYLCSIDVDPIEMTLEDIRQRLELSVGNEGVRVCETLLEKCGAIERLDSQQNLASVKIVSELPSVIDLLPRDAKVQRHVLRGVEKLIGTLGGERVYFAPRSLAESLEMKWDAVQRALRQLTQLDCFDYVPPFRGRAIHILRREPFEQLDIDFDELNRRKQEEYRRLETVIALAGSQSCRQLEILDYFGDAAAAPCGKCDNCLERTVDSSNEYRTKDNAGCLYAVQVALSGVARSRGRYGKTLIAQMLCGSSAKKLKQLGLNRLSTFGLLRSLSQSEAVELLDIVIHARFARQTELQKFRPIVEITDRGRDAMRGVALASVLKFMPHGLSLKLNALFRDYQPVGQQSEELSDEAAESQQVDSVSVDKQIKTAPPPVPLCDSRELADLRIDVGHDDQPTAASRISPSYFWTWHLFEQGYTNAEIQQIRRLSSEEIAAHLQIATENRLDVDQR